MLSSGRLPSGIEAPKPVLPPATAGEADIDAFLATVVKLDGELLPVEHRLFGGVTGDEIRKLQLIHCAHHFGHFRPTTV